MAVALLDGASPVAARVPFEPGGSFFLDDIGKEVRPNPADTIVRVIEEGSRWRNYTALVVEDDQLDGVPLLKSLKQAGIGKVIWAKTAYGALYQLKEDKELFPDFVVVDASLAGAGGLRLIRRIRVNADEQIRSLPIIVTTADGSPGIFERTSRFEISAYLRKPIGVGCLFDALVRASEGYKIPPAWAYENVEKTTPATFNPLLDLVVGIERLLDEMSSVFASPPQPANRIKVDLIA